MPQVGDNFMSPNSAAVYYYNGNGKLLYPSIDCYKSNGNPEFGTPYEMGGIKIITDNIGNQIPYLGKLCQDSNSTETIVLKPKTNPPLTYYLDKNILLDKFSDHAHLFCYFLLGISLMNYFRNLDKKWLYTFGCSLIGGIVLEIIQGLFIMGRNASVMDVCLNQTGCVLGILIFILFTKYFKTAKY